MGLETGTRITDLVSTNPTATDLRSQGDDHIRLMKTILKTELISLLGCQGSAPITISGGVLTMPALQSALVLAAGEGAVADNLDTISGAGTHEGMMILVCSNDVSNPVTLKHGTGNLYLLRGKDALLNTAGEYILLIFFTTLWREIVRGNISEYLTGDTIAALTITTLTRPASDWPSAWAYRSAALNAVDYTIATELVLDAEAYDTNNNFNTTTGRFTPTVAGKYLVTAKLRVANLTAGNDLGQIRKNGVATAGNYVEEYFRATPVANASVVQLSGIFDMNGSTDYLSCWFDMDTDTSMDIGTGAHITYMQVSRIA